MPIQIAVIDDHPLFREGVVSILRGDDRFSVVGQGTCADDAIAIAKDTSPDLLLLDISMHGGGLRAARVINQSYPQVVTVVLTVSEDDESVVDAITAGAAAYVLKGVSSSELINVLLDVHRGPDQISASANVLTGTSLINDRSSKTPRRAKPPSALTPRESEILDQLCEGLSNKQIAFNLSVTERTVKHHISNILHKLGVRNRVEAALIGQRERIQDAR